MIDGSNIQLKIPYARQPNPIVRGDSLRHAAHEEDSTAGDMYCEFPTRTIQTHSQSIRQQQLTFIAAKPHHESIWIQYSIVIAPNTLIIWTEIATHPIMRAMARSVLPDHGLIKLQSLAGAIQQSTSTQTQPDYQSEQSQNRTLSSVLWATRFLRVVAILFTIVPQKQLSKPVHKAKGMLRVPNWRGQPHTLPLNHRGHTKSWIGMAKITTLVKQDVAASLCPAHPCPTLARNNRILHRTCLCPTTPYSNQHLWKICKTRFPLKVLYMPRRQWPWDETISINISDNWEAAHLVWI